MPVKATPERPKPIDFKIIGACMPRSGTFSMMIALDKLGIKSHHMTEVTCDPDQMRIWQKASEQGLSPAEWDDLLRPYQACVDVPSAAHYKTLANIYPDAKVLITTRDDASWFKSTQNSIRKSIHTKLDAALLYLFVPSCRPWLSFMSSWLNHPDICFLDGKPQPNSLSTYVREVQAFFAARGESDRVFVYDLDKAPEWKGICEWLNLPIPDEPWPFENASIAGTTTVAVDGTVRTAASTFSNLRNNSGAAKMRQEKLRAIKHNLLLGAAGIIGVAAVSSAYWSKVAKRF